MTPLLQVRIGAEYRNTGARVRNVAFSVGRGEVFGVAGESGAGKSTVAYAILKLLEFRGGKASGEVLFRGRNLLQLSERELRSVRGRHIALLPQNPAAALNPALRLRTQFREAWLAHDTGRDAWMERAIAVLRAVGLNAGERFFDRFPRELSIGMAQRVLIGMSLLHRPDLLVADEPTSALDVVTQAEVWKLLRRLNEEYGLALLVISHDLLSLASICDRIGVMRSGELVEVADARRLLFEPQHPYTAALAAALLRRSPVIAGSNDPFME